MKVVAVYLILVGIIWALCVGVIYFAMGSIAEPVSITTTSLYYARLLIGPILLIVGSALVLTGSRAKLGVCLIIVSCVILTALVVHEAILGLRVRPLEAKPPYTIFAVIIVMTILADIAAVWLCRLVWFVHNSATAV